MRFVVPFIHITERNGLKPRFVVKWIFAQIVTIGFHVKRFPNRSKNIGYRISYSHPLELFDREIGREMCF